LTISPGIGPSSAAVSLAIGGGIDIARVGEDWPIAAPSMAATPSATNFEAFMIRSFSAL
jgi:hypothetical protein